MSLVSRYLWLAGALVACGCPQTGARDAGLDAVVTDTPRDVVRDVARDTAADVALTDAGYDVPELGCVEWGDAMVLPPPLPGASCGSRCTMIARDRPSPSGSIRETPTGVLIGRGAFQQQYDRATNQMIELFPASRERGYQLLCYPAFTGVASGTANLTAFNAEEALAECSTEDGLWLFRTRAGERRSCPVYFEARADELQTAPDALVRLQHGYAWHRGLSNRYKNLYLWDDGTSRARALMDCNCITRIAGGDDVLFWARYELPGGANSTLWMSRAPFRTTQQIFAFTGGSITWMSVDPANPRHLVFAAGRGDDTCPSRSEIYFYDAAGTDPPRQLTHDDANQLYPVVRGDSVAYADLSADRIDPNGCIDFPHDPWQLRVMNLRTGESAVVNEDRSVMQPALLTSDRLYLSHAAGFGFVPLPPAR